MLLGLVENLVDSSAPGGDSSSYIASKENQEDAVRRRHLIRRMRIQVSLVARLGTLPPRVLKVERDFRFGQVQELDSSLHFALVLHSLPS